jgi:hypothetical protein
VRGIQGTTGIEETIRLTRRTILGGRNSSHGGGNWPHVFKTLGRYGPIWFTYFRRKVGIKICKDELEVWA